MANKKIKAPKKGKKKKIFKKKMEKVLGEYKSGDLNIGKSNKKVKSKDQAIAIALNESKKAVKRGSVVKPKNKSTNKKNNSKKKNKRGY